MMSSKNRRTSSKSCLAVLRESGFDLNDLLHERERRENERGGFNNKVFLDYIGDRPEETPETVTSPAILFTPSNTRELLLLINGELAQSDEVLIASAFYSPGILNLLLGPFDRFVTSGGRLRILLSTMGNFTPPDHLEHLKEFFAGEVKVFHPSSVPLEKAPPDFHVKAHLFHHRNGSGGMLIGSSNLTRAGFSENIEWNYFSPGEINLPFDSISIFQSALDEFRRYWDDDSVEVGREFLDAYRKRWTPQFPFSPHTLYELPTEDRKGILEDESSWQNPLILPNEPQKMALESLAQMRVKGATKAAVIAATGIGKTYLSALDFKNFGKGKLLYIAHREKILSSAIDTFRRVLDDKDFGITLGGGRSNRLGIDGVFAMVQTLSRESHLNAFTEDHFDYIVIDEFHHSEAATYRRILEFFKPKFLLGMTATPERMDGRDILAHCDYNIAYEVRLLEAVDQGWLAPFQYFAIHDETDYSQIQWRGTRYDETELERVLINDTRTAVVAKNLRKFLPCRGKIKALAFCSSVAHARYTAKRLTEDFNLPATSLAGTSSEEDREAAIGKLRSEADPLQIICSVDIFNEGIDIPELTHVLLLRPTDSFTLFVQQLGRGLRKAPWKNFLVIIDFVGNFRKAHIAPLALMGYSSVQRFFQEKPKYRSAEIAQFLPRGCYVSADLEVQRIWDGEIRRVLQQQISQEDRLKFVFVQLKEDLEGKSPTLMDFYGNSYDVDPIVFIKQFGNWIKAKLYCEGDLPKYERDLLGTPGEEFLQYLERDLNPVRSYKMVVLLALLDLPGTSWKIEEIAKGFISYFLSHPERIYDYEDLAKAEGRPDFSLRRVVTKIKQMPLHFLSNTEKDYFVLDSSSGLFELREAVKGYWHDKAFKALVRERVDFALARYFQRKGLQQTVFFDPTVLTKGFPIEKGLAKALLGEDVPPPGSRKPLSMLLGEERFEAYILRAANGVGFQLTYGTGTGIEERLTSHLTPSPKRGSKVFRVQIQNGSLRLEMIKNTDVLRGITVELDYNVMRAGGYTSKIREVIHRSPEADSWGIVFEKQGYVGDMDIEVKEGGTFLAWTRRTYDDKSRFPARIKAAATALHEEGIRGNFRITSSGNTLTIKRLESFKV